jgi:hypothetical protein
MRVAAAPKKVKILAESSTYLSSWFSMDEPGIHSFDFSLKTLKSRNLENTV